MKSLFMNQVRRMRTLGTMAAMVATLALFATLAPTGALAASGHVECETAKDFVIRPMYKRSVAFTFDEARLNPLDVVVTRSVDGDLESRVAEATPEAHYPMGAPSDQLIWFDVTGEQLMTFSDLFHLGLPQDLQLPTAEFKAFLDVEFDLGRAGWLRIPLTCNVK